jgi:hypothetical protein
VIRSVEALTGWAVWWPSQSRAELAPKVGERVPYRIKTGLAAASSEALRNPGQRSASWAKMGSDPKRLGIGHPVHLRIINCHHVRARHRNQVRCELVRGDQPQVAWPISTEAIRRRLRARRHNHPKLWVTPTAEPAAKPSRPRGICGFGRTDRRCARQPNNAGRLNRTSPGQELSRMLLWTLDFRSRCVLDSPGIW